MSFGRFGAGQSLGPSSTMEVCIPDIVSAVPAMRYWTSERPRADMSAGSAVPATGTRSLVPSHRPAPSALSSAVVVVTKLEDEGNGTLRELQVNRTTARSPLSLSHASILLLTERTHLMIMHIHVHNPCDPRHVIH